MSLSISGNGDILTLSSATTAAAVYTPAGTGAVPTTVQAELRRRVSATNYGADDTGVSSSSAAIALALAVADTVEFDGGTYFLTADLQLANGKKLIGKNGATIKRETDVRLIGSSASLSALVAAAAMDYGSSRITLDAASYAAVNVGDYLYVVDDDTVDKADFIQDVYANDNSSTAELTDPSDWIYQVQTFKIVEKLASNIVRINGAARANYPLTTTGAVYKVSTTIEDVVLDGITFENGAGLSGASAEAAFINTDYVYGLTVKNCTFNLKGYTGGIYMEFGQANILNNFFNMPAQLGVFLRQNVADSVITGNVFKNQMTGDASIFVEAHNYNVTIVNNVFDGARLAELADAAQLISAVQMDAKVSNCSISGNTVNGYGVGVRMELGCMFNTITNNTISNIDLSGIRMTQCSNNTVTGNTFYNCGIPAAGGGSLAAQVATWFIQSTYDCIFSNNIVSCDSGKTVKSFYLSGDGNVVTGNTFTNVTAYDLISTENTIANNTGSSPFASNHHVGLATTTTTPTTVSTTKTVTIADNVATTLFTITTPNIAGSFDGGCYACRIHLVASFGAGSAAVASKGQFVMFTVANAASGTQDVSAVVTGATTARADPGGFTDLTDPVVTLVQTSNYVIDVQIQTDGQGVVGTGQVTLSAELVWTGYATPPVIS